MSHTEDYARKLANWESEDSTKNISNILLRIQGLKNNETQKDLTLVLESLNVFHKQANKADKQKVDESWFKEIIKSKNHIKSLIEQVKKNSIKEPKLIKSSSHIDYPEEEWEGKSEQYKLVIRSLYKNFIINLEEEEVKEKKQKTIKFLDEVITHLFQEFGFDKEKVNKDENQTSKMMYRIENINKELLKSHSTEAKREMIEGQGDAEKVAKNDHLGFESKETERIRQEKLEAIAKENQTGFYDEMKKNINKDAKEECRFCRKPTAYCEGQKQIRASDEPMTRFMICNTCGKRWRQE